MYLEHIVYSTAIAIIVGLVAQRFTGRDHSWVIIASAYAPDIDVVGSVGLSLLFGISLPYAIQATFPLHSLLHTLAALIVYAAIIAILLRPYKIPILEGACYGAIGYGSHLLEDVLVYTTGYPVLWPISSRDIGFGIFGPYHRDFFGIANTYVLLIGIALVLTALTVRIAYEGTTWIKVLFSFHGE